LFNNYLDGSGFPDPSSDSRAILSMMKTIYLMISALIMNQMTLPLTIDSMILTTMINPITWSQSF
jgi:hypothetical protein